MKKIIFLFLIFISTGCCLFKSQVKPVEETWQKTPSTSTTKIKITTNLSNHQLKAEFLNKFILRGHIKDTIRSFEPLTSDIKYVDNYYIKLYVSFKDSIATIYGEAGNLGINYLGQQSPAYHQVNWKPIMYNGRGWEIMRSLVGINKENIEYNTEIEKN